MTEKEIIQAWKKNEKAWMFLPTEMTDWASERWSDMVYLNFEEKHTVGFDYDKAYQLRPDYPEPSGVVECEVKAYEQYGGSLRFKEPNGQAPYDLYTAITYPDFIGNRSGDWLYGRVYKQKDDAFATTIIKYSDLADYEVLPIDAVVFKEVER